MSSGSSCLCVIPISSTRLFIRNPPSKVVWGLKSRPLVWDLKRRSKRTNLVTPTLSSETDSPSTTSSVSSPPSHRETGCTEEGRDERTSPSYGSRESDSIDPCPETTVTSHYFLVGTHVTPGAFPYSGRGGVDSCPSSSPVYPETVPETLSHPSLKDPGGQSPAPRGSFGGARRDVTGVPLPKDWYLWEVVKVQTAKGAVSGPQYRDGYRGGKGPKTPSSRRRTRTIRGDTSVTRVLGSPSDTDVVPVQGSLIGTTDVEGPDRVYRTPCHGGRGFTSP